MSLNKTLDRFFDEIRREAKRNPKFADRLDAVLRNHESRREVPDEVLEAAAQDNASPARGGGGERQRAGGGKANSNRGAAPPQSAPPTAPPQAGEQLLNPAGLYKKDGEEALSAALSSHDLSALRALVAEHNLDPSGVTPALTRDELAAHIVAQAKRRAERDEKMFDY
ncbi:MAG: hypothetical protein A4S17_10190 [Proteobacteria bacterium HN_bin10]|nr:MAG: hypothetical protein A4S17_10190 [Proteobacteria bacterium HN_bin10]